MESNHLKSYTLLSERYCCQVREVGGFSHLLHISMHPRASLMTGPAYENHSTCIHSVPSLQEGDFSGPWFIYRGFIIKQPSNNKPR